VVVGYGSKIHPLAVPSELEVACALMRDGEGLEVADRYRAVEGAGNALELRGAYGPA